MYDRGGSGGSRDWRRMIGVSSTPFTFGIMAAYVILFFTLLLTPPGLASLLAFQTEAFPARFWTLFTWPLVCAGDPLSLIFALGWTYLFAGSMERSWGTRGFATFFVAVNVLTALVVWLGSLFLGPGVLSGLWVATAPAVVAWSVVNAREVVSFFFLPIPGPFWGIIGAAIAFFYGGAAYGKPLLGLLATAGCAAAYWYAKVGRYRYPGFAAGGGSGGGGTGQRFGTRRGDDPVTAGRFRDFDREGSGGPRRGFSLARWWRERQERKRLEEIFRRSGFSDSDEKRR